MFLVYIVSVPSTSLKIYMVHKKCLFHLITACKRKIFLCASNSSSRTTSRSLGCQGFFSGSLSPVHTSCECECEANCGDVTIFTFPKAPAFCNRSTLTFPLQFCDRSYFSAFIFCIFINMYVFCWRGLGGHIASMKVFKTFALPWTAPANKELCPKI